MTNENCYNLALCLGVIGIILFLSVFVIDYINLEKFKSCYDINFQDNKCQKYLNY